MDGNGAGPAALSANPDELYRQTTQAMIELIGLDVALVLLRHGANWKAMVRFLPREDDTNTVWVVSSASPS